MNAPEVVYRYAGTLLDAAKESDALEAVGGDVASLVVTLEQAGDLVAFVRDPLADAEVKENVLGQLFEAKVHELTLNFLKLLARRRRINLLPEILATFVELSEAERGQIKAEVVSAIELDDGQLDRLRQRLAGYTGKEVILSAKVEAGLKAGMIVRIGDTVFDGSLASQLRGLRRRLVGS
jgi:F-type H+-transporting ATPase subunit delta